MLVLFTAERTIPSPPRLTEIIWRRVFLANDYHCFNLRFRPLFGCPFCPLLQLIPILLTDYSSPLGCALVLYVCKTTTCVVIINYYLIFRNVAYGGFECHVWKYKIRGRYLKLNFAPLQNIAQRATTGFSIQKVICELSCIYIKNPWYHIKNIFNYCIY